MPIADQLRTERRRRARHRRLLVGVLAALLVVRLTVSQIDEPSRARPAALTTTPTTPTTAAGPNGLEPGLVAAFERARAAAAAAGHDLTITSGFRTAAEQAAMLEAEIDERGSRDEALWWVFPPERSMHVQGLAIDVGDGEAADWLADHGARYGLCKTLAWEWWHFEWRERWAESRSCPRPAESPDEAPTG